MAALICRTEAKGSTKLLPPAPPSPSEALAKEGLFFFNASFVAKASSG